MRFILFVPFVKNDFETKEADETTSILGSWIRNSCRVHFLPLFVTKNGILRFSAFGLINGPESNKANETSHNMRVADQKDVGYNF